MSENLTTNVELDSTVNGTVSFATDVVATIAGLAATEVEGVAAMINNGNLGLVDMLRKNQGNRALTRGVKAEITGNQVRVQLTITVDYGSPVPTVAREIQDNVKKAIETMTGLEVPEINIYVQGISFEKENRATAALEQKQRAELNAAKVERLGHGDDAKTEDKTDSATADDQDGDKRRSFRGGFSMNRHDDDKEDAAEDKSVFVKADYEETENEPDTSASDGAVQPVNAEKSESADVKAESDNAAEQSDDDDEPMCDGHCDTCTLECDASDKTSTQTAVEENFDNQ